MHRLSTLLIAIWVGIKARRFWHAFIEALDMHVMASRFDSVTQQLWEDNEFFTRLIETEEEFDADI